MERLEPVLKQKFWILLGIGIVMTITGWWLATSSMASTILTREKEIKEAFGKVPSGTIPNDSWTNQLAARNGDQDRAVLITKRELWENQKRTMTWPETVAEFAWEKGYRGEIQLTGRENYRTAYDVDVRRVWESVRPFDPLTGTGIVEFGSQQMEALPHATWGALAPSSAEMWDAQEDLWLQESILRAIVEVNGGPNTDRLDTYIHQIDKFELHGGQPPAQRKSVTSAAPGGGPGSSPGGAHGGAAPGAAAMAVGGPGLGGLGGASRTTGSALASADFDFREELGEDGSGSVRQGGGGGGMGMSLGSATAGPGGAHSAGPGGAGGAAAAGSSGSKVRRYIEDDAALPYKTRGFYLSVLMDHRKIPTLISELTSSERSAWPVEIVRVQMARLHDDDVEGSGAGGGMPGQRGSGAFGGPVRRPMSMSVGPGEFGVGGAGREAGGAAANNPQAESANAQLASALQDPSMAKVAICGIITLYKEPKAEPNAAPAAASPAAPQSAPGGVPAPGTPATQPDPAATLPTPEKPAEGAAPEQPMEKEVPTPDKPDPNDPATNPPGEKPESPPAADPKATEPKPSEPKAPAEPGAATSGNNPGNK